MLRCGVIPDVRTLLREVFGGRGLSWWYEHRAELEAAGFPKRDDLIGGWSRLAIGRWEAERAGVPFPGDIPQPHEPTSAFNDREAEAEALRRLDGRANALRD